MRRAESPIKPGAALISAPVPYEVAAEAAALREQMAPRFDLSPRGGEPEC